MIHYCPICSEPMIKRGKYDICIPCGYRAKTESKKPDSVPFCGKRYYSNRTGGKQSNLDNE
jgi:ribosomal protein L37AE/L43A